MMAQLSFMYPRDPIDVSERLRALPDDGSIPCMPGWRWIHTPGHMPGHASLFRDSDRTLIVGDAFCTTKQESVYAVLTQKPELHGPPAYFTTDWVAARQSVHILARLKPKAVAPGHGQPLDGAAASEALDELAERFDEIAAPAHGRYVQRRVRRRAYP